LIGSTLSTNIEEQVEKCIDRVSRERSKGDVEYAADIFHALRLVKTSFLTNMRRGLMAAE
jgi:hypothetical protein